MEVHGGVPHGASPRTQPWSGLSNVADIGTNPAGTGPSGGPAAEGSVDVGAGGVGAEAVGFTGGAVGGVEVEVELEALGLGVRTARVEVRCFAVGAGSDVHDATSARAQTMPMVAIHLIGAVRVAAGRDACVMTSSL